MISNLPSQKSINQLINKVLISNLPQNNNQTISIILNDNIPSINILMNKTLISNPPPHNSNDQLINKDLTSNLPQTVIKQSVLVQVTMFRVLPCQ